MLGAVCGDILGSTYEIEMKEDVYLFHKDDHFTDDTVLTCAIAEWCIGYSYYGMNYLDWVMRYYVTGKIPEAPNSFGNFNVGSNTNATTITCNVTIYK